MQDDSEPSRKGLAARTAAEGSAPQHPLDARWHIHVSDKTYGPFTGHELKEMSEDGQFTGDDLAFPESGSEWRRASQDPILSVLFRVHDSSETRIYQQTPFRRHPRKVKLAVTIGFVAVLLGWVIWPYYAVYDLVSALRSGDTIALENRIGFESLRMGLRNDLNAIILQKLKSTESGTNAGLGNAFAALMGPAIVNQIVEGYVTPQGLALLVQSGKNSAETKRIEAPSTNNGAPSATAKFTLRNIRYAFFSSLSTFKVEMTSPSAEAGSEPIGFLLSWNGTWRLSRLILPDPQSLLSTAAKEKLARPIETVSAPKEPSTEKSSEEISPSLTVVLLKKQFVPANPEKNLYQAQIALWMLFRNVTQRDIRAFDGVIEFRDLLDNHVFSSRVEINQPIKSNATLNWDGAINFNQFMDDHQRLRSEGQENLQVVFKPRKVLFADGEVKEYSR